MIRVLLVHQALPLHGGVTRSFLTLARYADRGRVEFQAASAHPLVPEDTRAAFDELSVGVHALGRTFPGQLRSLKALAGK